MSVLSVELLGVDDRAMKGGISELDVGLLDGLCSQTASNSLNSEQNLFKEQNAVN